MCGGGGSGAASAVGFTDAGGGHRGEVKANQIRVVTPLQGYPIEIGLGGEYVVNGSNGRAGDLSSFNNELQCNGGSGGVEGDGGSGPAYNGNGASYVSPCSGATYYDGALADFDPGYARGGQAGAWGNGGFGWVFDTAGDGGIGAGGGGVILSDGGGEPSGSGGSGKMVIEWGS